MNWAVLAPAVLENDRVRLRPLTDGDRESLRRIASDPDIWRYWGVVMETAEDFDRFFAATLADQRAGRRVVFHITDKVSGRTAGSISLGGLAEADGRVEIGWSWLGADLRGTEIDHWSVYLLLEHVFTRLRAQRVEFRTDALNRRARRALRNIGAREEGVLRSFEPMPDGRRRDTVCHSILAWEWPALERRLAAGPRGVRIMAV
ncbi:GNAT family N-acetyltransferase [Streptomyces sp. NPDC048219]|uniref:GNAT family N-acetyltransferase n=1 Tax=Streptomyces sp. NPDC048219 TaxID=3365517 RepID=UPI003712E50C